MADIHFEIIVHFANVGTAAIELPDGTAIYPRNYNCTSINDFITGDIFIPKPILLNKYDCTYVYGAWFTDAKDAIIHRAGNMGMAAIYYNNGNCSYYYPL